MRCGSVCACAIVGVVPQDVCVCVCVCLSYCSYRKEVIRAYILESRTLKWCKNPRGCDGILQSDGQSTVCNTTHTHTHTIEAL